jgi:hypothetical protein
MRTIRIENDETAWQLAKNTAGELIKMSMAHFDRATSVRLKLPTKSADRFSEL